MTLDPQVQVILDFMSEMGILSDTTLSAVELRATMDATSGEVLTPVADVQDRTIPGGDGQDMLVRIYRPDGAPSVSPAVVFFHGGGWVIASVETHDDTCRRLANLTGTTWISVDYRLAPEAIFPAAVHDCVAAVDWVRENAGDLAIDPTRIAVAGDSAGGNLAAVVALDARDRNMPVAAQALIYPCTDMDPSAWPSMEENASGYFLTRDFMHWFYDQYVPDAEQRTDPRAAPIHAADHTNLPPAIVVTAEYDPLRDEGEAYADKLAAAGVPVTKARYDGMMHGFFGMSDAIDRAADAQAEVASFLVAALSGGLDAP